MTLQFTIPDMACSACATTITQAVNTIDPAAKVSTDTKTKQVQIDTIADEATVKQAIMQAGYSPA